MTDAEFLDRLARDHLDRCIVVQLDYQYESAGAPATGTLNFSDKVYFDPSRPSPEIPYIDCINSIPNLTRALSGDRLGSFSSSNGTLELDNADSDLDFIPSLAIDGSEVRVYYGMPDWPFTDFRLIFSVLAVQASAPSFDRISILLKDTGLLLNKVIGGTVLVGGSGANADKFRPFDFGYVHNVQALVIDSALLLYAAADTGTDTTIPEVRDRGIPVSFTDNGDGTFTLAASPDGVITCDVQSDPGSLGRNISKAFHEIVGVRAGLIAATKYAGAHQTFVDGDSDDPLCGISISDAQNIQQPVLTQLVDTGNCSWAITRDGKFTYLRLRPDDIASLIGLGTPALAAVDILEDDLDEGTYRLDHSQALYYQYQGYMHKNWLKQTDLASSLTPEQAAVWNRDGLPLVQVLSGGTTYNDAPELYNKSLSVSPVTPTLISGDFGEIDLPALQQWMDTRRLMWLPWIEIASFTVGIDFYKLELGDIVNLIVPRFGEDSGTLFQVISSNIRLSKAKIDLRVVRRRLLAAPPESYLRLTDLITAVNPPFALGKQFLPPIITTDPPPIFGGGTSHGGVSIDRDGHVSFRPVTTGAARFFRPPLPPTDGYIVFRHIDGEIGVPPEGGAETFVPGVWFNKDGTSARMSGYLTFSATVPVIDGVTALVASMDTFGFFEETGTTDISGRFTCPAICVPAYSWDLAADYNMVNGSAFTLPGLEYVAINTGGFFGAGGNDENIFAVKFWAAGVHYLAYMIRPDGTTGSGQNRYIGITTNTDIRAVYGSYTVPPERTGALSSATFASGGWVNGTRYREPIPTLPKHDRAYISGPSITSPFSGFAVTMQQGTITLSITEVAPPNDNFANATLITGGAVTNQLLAGVTSNQNATTEGSEPCGVGTATKTSWWTFTPVASGTFSCKTIGSYRSDDGSYSNPLDTVATVYTGASVGALTQIATNDNGGVDVTSDTGSFAVTGGVKYYIQISVRSGTGQYGGVKLTYTTSGALVSPPVITTSPNPGNPIIQSHLSPVSIAPAASNSPTSWSDNWLTNLGAASTRPTGLSFNTSTGAISGTASAGNSPGQICQIFATNAAGTSAPYQVVVFLT